MIPPEIPSLYPLQYITPPTVFQYVIESANKAIISSLIPYDSNEALAIFISEGAGGFFGGIASKTISRIDGNPFKGGSEVVNAAGAGTYFGVAGAVRSLAYAAGASQLAVSLSALLTSVAITKVIEIRGKFIEEQRTTTQSSPNIKMYDLMKFKDPSMRDLMYYREFGMIPDKNARTPMLQPKTRVEVQADAAQYTLLSILVPNGAGGSISLEESAIIGAVCGLVGQTVREAKDREMEEQRQRVKRRLQRERPRPPEKKTLLGLLGRLGRSQNMKIAGSDDAGGESGTGLTPMDGRDYVITRLARAAVEGAAQLLTYQAARDYVREISPYFQKLDQLESPLGPIPVSFPQSLTLSNVDAASFFINAADKIALSLNELSHTAGVSGGF